MVHVGVLTLLIEIPECRSLKEKRGRLKPLLSRLQREFNISVAEVDLQDVWDQAMIACSLVSSDANITMKSLQAAAEWVERSWPDVTVMDDSIEIR